MRSRLAQKKALTRRGVAAQETGAFRDHYHSRCLAKSFLLCSGCLSPGRQSWTSTIEKSNSCFDGSSFSIGWSGASASCASRSEGSATRFYGFNPPAFPSRPVTPPEVESKKLPNKNRPQPETAWLRGPLAPTQLPDTFRKAVDRLCFASALQPWLSVSLVGISGTSRLPVANAKGADKLRARTTARAHIAPQT
jgi:hypothetical protein